jgi:uncharacterized repeat protein (TIGR02543 family)
MPTDPTYSGHTFAGWNTASDGSGTSFDGTTPVTGDIIVYAQWTPIQTGTTYTVEYDANGGNGTLTDPLSPYNDLDQVTVLSPGTSITHASETFIEWNTAPDGSGISYDPDDTFTITANVGNVTLYAQWTQAGTVTTYRVTYRANGGTGSQSDPNSPYAAGDEVTVLGKGTMARTGYTFVGWNTMANGSGTDYDPNDKFDMPNHDVTLYAVWERVVAPVTYKVTFKANYGMNATIVTLTVNAGEALGTNMPLDPTRSGYTFVGWRTTSSSTTGTAFTASTAVTANITVYAQWQKDAVTAYKVTFYMNDGSGAVYMTRTVNTGNALGTNMPADPVRNGYTFTGWNTQANGNGTAFTANTVVNGNIVVYAQWAAVTNNDNSLIGGWYIPVIIGGTNYGSSISETEVIFDKNSSGDIMVMVVSGNSSWVGEYKLQCLKNKNRTLVKDVDYIVNGDIVTIKASYLKTLKVGEQTITFVMTGGADPQLNINITDTTP